MLDNPQLSLEDFSKQWNRFNLIDVDTIFTSLVFFKTYPTLNQDYLQGIGNWNEFQVVLLARDINNTIHTIRENLQIFNGEKIITNNEVSEEWLNDTNDILKLYYHLIASHRFEEAYNMQYEHTQTLSQFSNAYKNIL
jgi:hypothetical protein